MNLFQYKAKIAGIDSLKYVKDLEAEVRLLQEPLSIFNTWDDPRKVMCEATVFKYKAYTYALNAFAAKSSKTLPDFMYDTHTKTQSWLVDQLLKPYQPTCSYTDFIDIFEFDKHLKFNRNKNYMFKLDQIVGANSVHFTIDWNDYLTSEEIHTFELLDRQAIKQLKAIRYKLINGFINQPRTIIDMYIADAKSKSTIQYINQPGSITLDQQTRLNEYINALNYFIEDLPDENSN